MFLSKGFQAFISKPNEIGRLDTVLRDWVRDKVLERTIGQIEVNGTVVLDTRGGQDRRDTQCRRSGNERRIADKKVDGLDMNKGLDLFGGDEASYLQIMRSYTVNTMPLLEKIKTVTRESLADYAIVVHGIKGSSRGISADAVGDKAASLEEAAKEGNFNFVLDNNADFITAVEKLIGDMDTLLTTIELEAAARDTEKPVKDKPDSELLARLVAACEEGDIDAVDAAIKELDSYEYQADDGLAAWLRENAEQMHYAEIAEKVRGSVKSEE
jgi:HPt (histidine-containing phosphotransfer) domain-containing protein